MTLKENQVLRCPKCGSSRFFTSAHVVQDWEVDDKGTFVKTLDECIEVTHYPDNDDILDCAECDFTASAEEFITVKPAQKIVQHSEYPFAVVHQYSWTNDGDIVLFKTEAEAKKYIREMFEAEVQADTDSQKSFEANISEYGDYACIVNPRMECDDEVSEWILRCDAVRIPEPAYQPAKTVESELRNIGKNFVLPGDKVLVCVPAYRMWGGRCREDLKAPMVDVAGIVLTTNIDRTEDGELTFICDVAASVPIADTDRAYYGTFKLPMEMCTKIEVVSGEEGIANAV